MKVDNFVSLGSACPVAASMSKYGFRGFSGVFDWLVTESLQGVLYYLEHDFAGFLEKDNLELYEGNPKKFSDKSNGFIFLHEQVSFQEEYELLRDNYQRKIDRFLWEICKPTCFLRAVSSKEEIEYIVNNQKYIDKVIKKNNVNNQIVFLIKEGIEVKALPFPFFIMSNPWVGQPHSLLRGWFDEQKEFLEFCAERYDSVRMIQNMMFDNQAEKKKYQTLEMNDKRYKHLLKLLNTDINKIRLPRKVILYGAGNIGKQCYEMIKNNCEVIAFVDKSKAGTVIDAVPVLDISEAVLYRDIPYIITVVYDYDNICKEILEGDETAQIISLQEIIK